MKNVIQPLGPQVSSVGTSGPKLPPSFSEMRRAATGMLGSRGPKLPPSSGDAMVGALSFIGGTSGPKIPPIAGD
jgi:hypothetical protein